MPTAVASTVVSGALGGVLAAAAVGVGVGVGPEEGGGGGGGGEVAGVDGVVRGEGNDVRYALEGLRTRGRAGQGPVGNEDEDVDFGVCGDVVDAVDDDGLVDVMMGGDEAVGRGEDGGQQGVNARRRHLLVQRVIILAETN